VFEWLASQTHPRFKHYRKARQAYKVCLQELTKPFEDLETDDYLKWRNDARLVTAESHYREAIALCRQEQALSDMATSLYQLGMLLHLQGRLDEAEECVLASAKIQEGLPQNTRAVLGLSSGCHYHLGIIALKRGNRSAALTHLQTSLSLDQALDDLRGIMWDRSALMKCETLSSSSETEVATVPITPRPEFLPLITPTSPPDESETAPLNEEVQQGDTTGNQQDGKKLTRPFSLGEDVLWLVSHSIGANDSVMGMIEEFQNDFPRRTLVSRVAFGSPDLNPTPPEPIAQDSRLCAVILVVEPASFGNANFRYWARWCIRNVADRDDFRLFVYLHDLSLEALDLLANRPREHEDPSSDAAGMLADELIKTVQIPENASAEKLKQALIPYLYDLDHIRAAARWRRVKLGASVFFARVALTIQVTCGLALAAVGISWLAFKRLNWDIAWNWIAEVNTSALALVLGVPVFALQMVPLFLLLRGITVANKMLRDDSHLWWWLVLGALLCPAALQVPYDLGASPAMIVLGIVTGVLLDVLRRSGFQARRAQISLERAYNSVAAKEAGMISREIVEPRPIHPLTCPLFSADSRTAFISYRHHSPWSRGIARSLHAELERNRFRCFLDLESIGEGSGWRRALNRSIGEAQVFIALIEKKSLDSRWMAAELLAALAGRLLTHQPELILLVEPSLAASKLRGGWSVFRSVLDQASQVGSQSRIRLIQATETNIKILEAQLGALETVSLFPKTIMVVLKIFTLPLVVIGGLGSLLSIPAMFFAWLEQWEKFDSSGWIAARGFLLSATLLVGYWSGFTIRAALAARYEVRDETPTSLARIHGVAAAGLAWLAVLWSAKLPGLTAGWTIAAGYFGWLMAWCLISERIKRDPLTSL
jgi:tetratricopeptide (TPR) repeat protein